MSAADRAYLLRNGERIGDGATGTVLGRSQLEVLYQAPVELISDSATGRTAFLPG